MELPQYAEMASGDEEEAIRRLLDVKDRILKQIPEFRRDAEALRAELHPHDTRLLHDKGSLSEEEQKALRRKLLENQKRAEAFAKKWKLPWSRNPDVDPNYLVERPHAGAPTIHGTLSAVEEWGEEFLPVVVVAMDIRFPKSLLRERVERRIEEARDSWEARGLPVARGKPEDSRAYETMLEVWRHLKDGKKNYDEVAEIVGLSSRQVRNHHKAMLGYLRKRSVWEIAPYSHLNWVRMRRQAEANREASLSVKGRPFRVRPLL